MATYNVIEEGSTSEVVDNGSATVSTDPVPAAAYDGRTDYSAPQQQYGSASGGAYSSDFLSASPIGGVLPKVGLIGILVVICGIIIEYAGIVSVDESVIPVGSVSAIDTILILFPVILELLKNFRREKIPKIEVFNFITFIDAVCTSLWQFFVFVGYAEFSTKTDSHGRYGAAAAGAFFVFLGEAVIAFSSFLSM